jgi:hypothetical protein
MAADSRPPRLDVTSASDQLCFYLGAAAMALHDSGNARERQAADELWKLLPFVKALVTVGLASPATLELVWRSKLAEPELRVATSEDWKRWAAGPSEADLAEGYERTKRAGEGD